MAKLQPVSLWGYRNLKKDRTFSAVQKFLETPTPKESTCDTTGTETDIEFDNECDILGHRYVTYAKKEQLLRKLMFNSVNYEHQFFDSFPMFMDPLEFLTFLKNQYTENYDLTDLLARTSKLTATSLCSLEEIPVGSSSRVSGNSRTSGTKSSVSTMGALKKKSSYLSRKPQSVFQRTNTQYDEHSSESRKASGASENTRIIPRQKGDETAEGQRINTGSFSHRKLDNRQSTLISYNNPTGSKNFSTPHVSLFKNNDENRVRSTSKLVSLKLIRKWSFEYGQDFDNNPELCSELKNFLKDCEKEVSSKDAIWRQIDGISITLKENKTKEITRRNNLNNMYEEAFKIDVNTAITVIYSPMFADALTIIDLEKHKLINLRELINCSWTKENRLELAPSICEIIFYFNKVSNTIQRIILESESSMMRIDRILYFIKILIRLDEICNFNGCVAVISALNSLPVSRLTKSWSKIPSKKKKTFERLKEKYSVIGNYRNLRGIFETCDAMIPFIGCFLTQILHIHTGCSTICDDNRINFKKCRKVAAALQNIKKCNKYVKTVNVEPKILHETLALITSLPEMTDDELYDLSTKIDPNNEV